MSIAELLANLRDEEGRHSDRDRLTILPEAAIAELREYARGYWLILRDGVPFKPGDLVTPRSGLGIKGVGEPHIVLETRGEANDPVFQGEPSSSEFGRRLTVRVGCFMRGERVPFWMEAHTLEPYTGEGV